MSGFGYALPFRAWPRRDRNVVSAAVTQPPTLTADRLIKSQHRMLWSDQRAWIAAL